MTMMKSILGYEEMGNDYLYNLLLYHLAFTCKRSIEGSVCIYANIMGCVR